MLKSLEMFGFKSFADRTKFDFSKGLTCVVGPNGSGKSNVVDSLKWVLGDQSPKSLRGKEMTDVIFNGSANRKPSAYAEAILTFDNSRGFLPTDAVEVQVGRRLWQNGDSEYLINREPARLKDVRDLFMGTGAGSSAYSIIEQGRVEQILQANAATRRGIFEEASGISRYKARKIDAQRKLERVSQNLLRLTDIVDEVDAQLNSLRSQAAKASKFREISAELRTWWVGLVADDARLLGGKLETIEKQISEYEGRILDLNDQHQAIEHQLASLDVDIAEVDDYLRDAERKSAANGENIASNQTTIEHQTTRCKELEADLIRLRKQRHSMTAREQEISQEIDETNRELVQSEESFTEQKKQLQSQNLQIEEFSRNISLQKQQAESDRGKILELNRLSTDTGNLANSLTIQIEGVDRSAAELELQQQNLQQQVKNSEQACEARQAQLETDTNELNAVLQQENELDDQQKHMAGEQGEFQVRLAEKREQRSASQARLSVLEDLEQRQEGLGIGVKEILSRAKTSNYAPWNSILGSVADLLVIDDLEDAALLEVALGERSQLLVLKEFQPLIEYLNSGAGNISGRVGFIAVPQADSDEGGSAQSVSEIVDERNTFSQFYLDTNRLPDLAERDGVVSRADRLMKTEGAARPLAEHLLADTWIVETLDLALELSVETERRCRFVTLQGERLETNGTLFAGTVSSEAALVTRKSELRRLKNDILKLDRSILNEEEFLSNLSESLSELGNERASLRKKVQSAQDAAGKTKALLTGEQQEVQRLNQQLQQMLQAEAKFSSQKSHLSEELKLAQMQVAQASEDLLNLEKVVEQVDREISRIEHRLQHLEEKRNLAQLDSAKQEERLTAAQQAFGRLKSEQNQRQQQLSESQRRFTASAEKKSQIILHILNSNAELAELHLTREEMAEHVAKLLRQKQERRDQRTVLVSQNSDLREERRTLNERKHELEIQTRDLRFQVISMEERLEEEYQLVLEDVVHSGESAFRTYMEEKTFGTAENQHVEEQEFADKDDFVDVADADMGTLDQGIDDQNPATIGETDETTELELDGVCFEDVREEIETRVNRLRRKMKLMGSVNSDSLKDLDELDSRYTHLKAQLDDLLEAKTSLEEIIRKINTESKRLFLETFNAVQVHFRELFRKLFGGGEADIVLEDTDDVLECGIEIVVRPPGKELRSITLLSGGEKTMTAVALLLAIFKSHPSPFCILDEVDAALDEANVERYVNVVRDFLETTQFIMISHNKRSMVAADVLYGVTMEQSGVSKRMSVRFDDVSDDGNFAASESDDENLPDGDSSNDQLDNAA